MRTRFVGIALTTLLLMASAYADAVFTLGNHPQPGEQNIMFHTAMTGTMVLSPELPIKPITKLCSCQTRHYTSVADSRTSTQ